MGLFRKKRFSKKLTPAEWKLQRAQQVIAEADASGNSPLEGDRLAWVKMDIAEAEVRRERGELPPMTAAEQKLAQARLDLAKSEASGKLDQFAWVAMKQAEAEVRRERGEL